MPREVLIMSDGGKGKLLANLGNSFAKGAIGALPGGSFLTAGYEMIQLLSESVSDQIEARNEERYREFIHQLFGGNVEPAVTEFLTIDDYHALLSGCLSDIEKEKSGLYGALTRSIGLGRVDEKYKRFLIVALSQLSFQQVEMLRNAWIAKKFPLMPVSGSGNIGQEYFLKPSQEDLIGRINCEALSSRQLISEAKLTSLGDELVLSCYREHDLTVEAIGAKSWIAGVIDIVFSDDIGCKFSTALAKEAFANSIKSNSHSSMIWERTKAQPNKVLAYAVIVGDSAEPLIENIAICTRRIGESNAVLVFLGPVCKEVVRRFPCATVIDGEGSSHFNVAERVVAAVKELNGIR